MADKKITELPLQASASSDDLLLLVDNPNGTPVSKKISVKNLFGSVNANTVFEQSVSVAGDTVTIRTSKTPANSTVTVLKGAIFYDSTFLYVATDNNVIKRITLESF
jgi:hypothetical protein